VSVNFVCASEHKEAHMGIRFVPLHGLPIALDDTRGLSLREERWPPGWWMLPALIVGLIECTALMSWIVA